MRPAQRDAQIRKYRMFVGKSGRRWMVGAQPAEADNIYVEGGRGSKGFGGATLKFELEDGEIIALTGPWKTGADGLLKDTGYDATDKYTSRGIIALEREYDWKQGDLYKGVLYVDERPVIGTFDRVKELAQKFANDLGKNVYYAVVTYGGGSSSRVEPIGEEK